MIIYSKREQEIMLESLHRSKAREKESIGMGYYYTKEQQQKFKEDLKVIEKLIDKIKKREY